MDSEGNAIKVVYDWGTGLTYARINNDRLIEVIKLHDYSRTSNGLVFHTRIYQNPTLEIEMVKTNFVHEVTAPHGTYPENGPHKDGFWYELIK